ncbi:MAG TPA: UDP-N-acetylenolpyruvoylglucosamine reductase [Candidatus Moranbacteria bacterium]|nr:MAG: UDP-N-acetylenolpyruvoylglucosamine reductase [Candidatus Moranbacteria bacterium GW2011_GWC2_45_10]KKT95020.1 MAG: UDP-N-acetylenolpyruvoylglucosamine reductase [Parcubacteria group bacterium GW2011_GWC1_45_14]HAV11529.1 UDP-N-acetylenolpyruvoylglucosamine reductase [Candidatus Moranbacteria bacterium]
MIKIQKNVPLAEYTTFKVGGPAKFFVCAKNEDELVAAVEYAKENGLAIFVLGGGSNILVSDKGFDGLVIKLENKQWEIEGEILECGAGAVLFDVVKDVAQNNLSGFEWAAGIPGTFGGAVRGNAGAFWGDMSANIESVRALRMEDNVIEEFSKEGCEFGYRSSFFKKSGNLIVLSAKMRFKEGNREKSFVEMDDIVDKRVTKQPQDMPSAGSFFQNPVVEDPELVKKFEQDIGAPSRGGKVAAGWLIDQLGLRGKKIGGAMVSEKHANFLVNGGGAKAEDVIILVSYLKQQVRDNLGVQLVEEVQYVGF